MYSQKGRVTRFYQLPVSYGPPLMIWWVFLTKYQRKTYIINFFYYFFFGGGGRNVV